ncbi:hypothetical protein, partial [Klebsiella pneumoniae]|uniref:hypothetical protein n=1 Tax=Klebsiella pneumoniae TaxID=573 RepID=UPI0037C150CD
MLRMAAYEPPQQRARLGLRAAGIECAGRHLGQRLVIGQLGMRLQQPLRFALGIARLVLFALRVQPCQQLARRHRQRCDIRQRVDARGQAGHQRRSTTILAQLRQMGAGQFQLPQ